MGRINIFVRNSFTYNIILRRPQASGNSNFESKSIDQSRQDIIFYFIGLEKEPLPLAPFKTKGSLPPTKVRKVKTYVIDHVSVVKHNRKTQ